MHLRQFTTALALLAVLALSFAAPAAALPTEKVGREPFGGWALAWKPALSWLYAIVAGPSTEFVPAEGATITGNGGNGG